MKHCKNCNEVLTGKKRYCNDACRMAYGRKANTQPEQTQPEQVNPNTPIIGSFDDYQQDQDTNGGRYVTRANPLNLNWGKRMTLNELNQAGFKGNRVAIPGDHDYVKVTQ